jgi:hypothetical protein
LTIEVRASPIQPRVTGAACAFATTVPVAAGCVPLPRVADRTVTPTFARQLDDVAGPICVDQPLVSTRIVQVGHLHPGHRDQDDVALLVPNLELSSVEIRAWSSEEEVSDLSIRVLSAGRAVGLQVSLDS